MIIDTDNYELIKRFEGFKNAPYRCSAGKSTIGYGTTKYPLGTVYMKDRRISKEEAHLLLELHIEKHVKPAMKGLILNDFQREAVESFIFNVGSGAFKGSTLRKKLIKKDYYGASEEFLKWNKITVKGKKVTSKGLTKRRKAEKKLFDTPMMEIHTIPKKISFWDRIFNIKG